MPSNEDMRDSEEPQTYLTGQARWAGLRAFDAGKDLSDKTGGVVGFLGGRLAYRSTVGETA